MEETAVIGRVYQLPAPGAFHTSIVAFDWEYSYGQKGISVSEPETAYYEEQYLGKTKKSKRELSEYIEKKRQQWTSEKYRVIDHNCQNFSEMIIQFLNVQELPAWVKMLPNIIKNSPVILGAAAIASSCSSGTSGAIMGVSSSSGALGICSSKSSGSSGWHARNSSNSSSNGSQSSKKKST